MANARLKYEGIGAWSRELIAQALIDDAPEAVLRAVIAASMHDDDWKYAQDLCVRLSAHPHLNVRGNAVLGFGHIARVHGRLEERLVLPIIRAALKDDDEYVRSQACGARDDVEHFLGWDFTKQE